MDRHLFGVEEPGRIFLFGTDKLGRDLFSRTVYAARISLSIGLVGVAFSFVLGCMLGGISGYFGSKTDVVIQRIIEIFMSLPHIPLWIALAAALPREWSVIKTYFAITVILSLVGWTTLARVVRGKLITLREEEFVLAARISGMRSGAIILRHLLPSFMSYLVVNLTLAVPSMILGETALSFLGLGHSSARGELGRPAQVRPAGQRRGPVSVAADPRPAGHRHRPGLQLPRRRPPRRRRPLPIGTCKLPATRPHALLLECKARATRWCAATQTTAGSQASTTVRSRPGPLDCRMRSDGCPRSLRSTANTGARRAAVGTLSA